MKNAAALIIYVALSSLVHKVVIMVKATNACDCEDTSSVCGSDGQTYSSDCDLQCYGNKTGVYKVSDGPCNQVCACPFNYEPVCGTDDITYGNRCQCECEMKTKPGLTVAYLGECMSSENVGTESLEQP